MLNLTFGDRPRGPMRILCLGAHSDDIEIGCGGTLLRLLEEHPDTHVRWVVFGAHGARIDEANNSANRFLERAGRADVVVEQFRDGFFPYVGAEIKQRFEEMKGQFDPQLVFSHYRNDLHQDHRLISELTWNTYRDHLILEYEIPKYDGDFGSPNFFVTLGEPHVHAKVRNILECFASQRAKAWFSEDTFMAVLRLRGLECNAPDKYAEAFYCRKAAL